MLLYSDITNNHLTQLLSRYGLEIVLVPDNASIPGSFWGDDEAGLIGNQLYARSDTPVHSIMHEACHYICMPPQRRDALHTNAGGDYDEENAVCYLQILLAGELDAVGLKRMFENMDAWGYSFRLGSSRAWFEQDAEDARQWLAAYGLIDHEDQITWKIRETNNL